MKKSSHSLFFRLIVGFMCIIIIMVTINAISLSVSQHDLREEIVKYNMLNLLNTMDSYEKHFELVNKSLRSFLISDGVQNFRKHPNYIELPELRTQIRTIVANDSLLLDNIVLYSNHNRLILEKSASTTADILFNVFLKSRDYPLDFWTEQAAKPYTLKIHPVTSFMDHTYADKPSDKGKFFPIVYKNTTQDDFFMLALLDSKRMFNEFHHSINDNFMIIDDHINLLNREDVSSFKQLIDQNHERSFYINNGSYYFFVKGTTTGFTYVNIIPVEKLSTEVKFNEALVLFLMVSIAASITAALIFARRINKPLSIVLDSIQDVNTDRAFGSKIKEFDAIYETFRRMLQEKQEINKELRHKNSLLKHYNVRDKLKEIGSQVTDTTDLSFASKPFRFILFDLVYKHSVEDSTEMERKWTYYVKEFIDITLALIYKETFTFQMEKKQIVSMVFIEEGTDTLLESLQKLKKTFDQDIDRGFITIVLSSTYEHSADLARAYDEALELLSDRTLSGFTQIIDKPAVKKSAIRFLPLKEQEFDVNLREGNEGDAIQIVQQMYSEPALEHVPAVQLFQFSQMIVDKAIRSMNSLMIEEDQIQLFSLRSSQLKKCYSLTDLQHFMERVIKEACGLIRNKKEQKNDMIAFVVDYVEKNYDGELTLEMVADKLGISRGYLSSHFKEKKGMNFIDFVNCTRISNAQELLSDHHLKIQDVAKKVGYQNINSFNRMFRRFTGTTPGEYRRQLLDSV